MAKQISCGKHSLYLKTRSTRHNKYINTTITSILIQQLPKNLVISVIPDNAINKQYQNFCKNLQYIW